MSLAVARVMRVMEQLEEMVGLPKLILLDNDLELVDSVLVQRAEKHQIEMTYIQPGEQQQNVFIECLDCTYCH